MKRANSNPSSRGCSGDTFGYFGDTFSFFFFFLIFFPSMQCLENILIFFFLFLHSK